MALNTGNLQSSQPFLNLGNLSNLAKSYTAASNIAYKGTGITSPASANTALNNKLNPSTPTASVLPNKTPTAPSPATASPSSNFSWANTGAAPQINYTSAGNYVNGYLNTPAAKPSVPNVNPNPPVGTPTAAPVDTSMTALPQTPQTQSQSTSPALYSPSNPPTYPGLVSNLANASQTVTPDVDKYRTALQQSYENEANALANIEGSPHTVNFAQGAENVIRNQALMQQQGLSTALGSAVTTQGQQLGAMGQAAGLAQPQLGQFGQGYYNPLTSGSASGGGGTLNPLNNLDSIAQQVSNGTLTYSDAMNMGGSVANWSGALNQAIQQKNPNFNFAQAQALGSTQGTVAPSLNMAQKALTNLQNTFANTPWYQVTGVPAINALANLAAQTFGSFAGIGSETSKMNAINEARTQVANALGVMTNTTPSAWTTTVQSWFPDTATPDQVSAGMDQFNNLATNRQQIYGNPGGAQPFTAASGTSTSAGGYNFVQKADGTWAPAS